MPTATPSLANNQKLKSKSHHYELKNLLSKICKGAKMANHTLPCYGIQTSKVAQSNPYKSLKIHKINISIQC